LAHQVFRTTVPVQFRLPGQHKQSKAVKEAFLNIIDYVQSRPEQVDKVLQLILNKVIEVQAENIVNVAKLVNPDTLNIRSIVSCLEEHFLTKYNVRGGSKLPVLAIYAMYQSLLDEVKRYENCILAPLGSHTASDLTSKSSGDIEVFDEQGQICEAIEVKLDREIDLKIVRVAYEKIIRFNPKRYYILSCNDIKVSELQEINNIISQVREKHGCQIIINGVIPTIQYYLRLISLEIFVNNYSNLVSY
jgi:DNA (cytosine-5)-methyltransferase 1